MATDLYFSDMPQIARDFLNYLGTIKGRSVRTVEAYHIDLRLFLRFLKLCFLFPFGLLLIYIFNYITGLAIESFANGFKC